MNTLPRFLYRQPATLDEAVGLLQEYGAEARLIAGGTDLIVRMQVGKARPQVVIDVKRIAGLDGRIQVQDGTLRIGALAVMSALVAHPLIQDRFPALAEAAHWVGSVQIRNRATLAGNLCNASPAADTAPALLVYGAWVNAAGPGGRRSIPLNAFFTGPGQTVLSPQEIVTSVELPLPASQDGAAFARLTRRRGVDLATVNVACRIHIPALEAPPRVTFAYGAVGPTPLIVWDDGGKLINPQASAAEKDIVLAGLMAHTSPIDDVRASKEYRQAMLMVLSRRALSAALARYRA